MDRDGIREVICAKCNQRVLLASFEDDPSKTELFDFEPGFLLLPPDENVDRFRIDEGHRAHVCPRSHDGEIQETEWQKEPPWGDIKAGHEHFWIRGHADPESTAVAVKLVMAPKKTDAQMAYESAMIGLKWSRMWDVVGDGNEFEQRPLYEVEGALWKKRIVETSPDHQSVKR